ncbi:MAG TPA: carbohydrate porin [Phycisphaerales bacterium]|nr:carbohydrate porin [Phycisphaerales bacterium]HMP37954.1 carbohydrate porin [Phycisphaerales bacterium]
MMRTLALACCLGPPASAVAAQSGEDGASSPATSQIQPQAEPPSLPGAITEAPAASGTEAASALGPWIQPFQYEFSPGDSPASEGFELDEMSRRRRGIFDLGAANAPFDALRGGLDQLYRETGLRLGFAYTMLLQQASGGPGERTGTAGDIDFISRWTLVGRGTKDTGTLAFDGEYRFKVGDQPPSALGGVLGTLTNTTGGFSDRGWVVRDAYWLQRLFEDRLRLLAGRADVSDWAGATRLQSINLYFSNRAFSANASVAWPNGHGPAAGVSVVPTEWFYATGGIANGYNQSNTMEINSLEEGDFFYFTEFGLTPMIEGLGQGRARVLLWLMDERERWNLPEDKGISFILDQNIGEQLYAFLRYSYADATLTNIRNAVQAGTGLRGLLGSPDDVTGFAAGWGEPPGDGRDETVLELFHRFQLLESTQLTLGAQLILDPAFNPDQNTLGVFSVRLRVAF